MPSNKQQRFIIRPIGPSIAYIPLTQGLFALIDADSIGMVDGLNWQASRSKQGTFYVRSNKTYLHRLLLGYPDSQLDHRNGNPLDNRICNLRVATVSQNQFNMRKPRHNTSGFKGVAYNLEYDRWDAKIQIQGKQVRIGGFRTAQAAHKAYKEKALEVAGEFAKFD